MSDSLEAATVAQPSVVSLNLRDKAALYGSYMYFIQGGAVFIPTTYQYHLGDEVFMLLSLPDDPAKIAVSGKVIWMSPAGAQSNRQQGIGVQFADNEAGLQARVKIEGLLGASMQSSQPTYTL